MKEVLVGLSSFAPQLVWAIGLILTGRTRRQPALTSFLLFSGGTGALLFYGNALGFLTSKAAYLALYVANEVISLALLSAAFLELATIALSARPRFQEFGHKMVSRLLTACVVAAVLVVALPLALLQSISRSHVLGAGFIGAGLAAVWITFYIAGRYQGLQLDRRTVAEGSVLATLYLGYSILLAFWPAWKQLGVCILWAAGFGCGAVISFFPRIVSASTAAAPVRCEAPPTDEDVRAALARLEFLDDRLDVAGKG